MEVSDRSLPQRPFVAPARLHLTRAALAFAAALAASLGVAFAQPLGSPWWMFADAPYAASGANLMAGEHSLYLDRPGLPLQDLMAITFEGRYLAHKLFVGDASPHGYMAERLLNLDDSAPYWRAFAVLFWVFGAGVAFVVGMRLLGHWGFGLAASLLWIGAPGLAAMSIQYRPDVLLSALALLVVYLIARGAERGDAWLYALAALVIGLATTLKLHAVGLVVPLALALIWRPPAEGWPQGLLERLRATVARHRAVVGVALAAWVALAIVFNRRRFPFDTSASGHRLLAYALVGLGAYLALSVLVHQLGLGSTVGRLLNPFAAVLGLALGLGILLPATLFLDDGLLMLARMKDGLTGAGVGGGIDPFSFNWNSFGEWPLRQALFVVLLGGVGAAFGLAKRDPLPVLWFAAAAVMGLIAAAPPGTAHYFAPCYVLSIPAALWLFRRRGGAPAAAALALVVAYVLVPQAQHLRTNADRARTAQEYAAAAQGAAETVLKRGDVAISDPLAAVPDLRYHDLVDVVTSYAPDRPYRLLPHSTDGIESARRRQLRLSHYIGRVPARIGHRTRLTLGLGQTYEVRPLPDLADPAGVRVLELLRGEGVDRPYRYPDAPYDPWTGHYRFESRYYDFWGNEIVNPVRRRYIARLGLWLDVYGDFWDANGRLVMSKPELRTAK